MDDTIDDLEVGWRDVYPQLLGGIVMSLTSICGGLSSVFTNLLDDIADRDTKSWLASVTSLFNIVGTLLAGPLVDKMGRKSALLTIDIISILSWIFIVSADHNRKFCLFVGVPMTGIVRGGIAVANVVFISEITYKKYRSMMLSFTLVYFTLGVLLSSFLAIFLSWRMISLLCLIFFSIIFILTKFYVTESPVWLGSIEVDMDAARHCLKKLNPNEKLFESEWLEMKKSIFNDGNIRRNHFPIMTITKPSFYKPASVLIVLLTLSQMSGVSFMMYFITDAIPEIGFDVGNLYKKEIFLIIGISKFVLGCFTTSLSTRFGRKQLLYASCFGTVSSSLMIVFCDTIYLKSIFYAYILNWIKISAFVIYMSFGSFGMWLIPYTLIGELLPNELRGLCSPFFICWSYGVMSFGAKLFPILLDKVPISYIFLFYICNSVVTFAFVRCCVPETGGKTLKEIEDFFKRKKFLPISKL